MLLSTLSRLRCPACPTSPGELAVAEARKKRGADILFGTLECEKCDAQFPILAGVAVLVIHVEAYLQFHVKGISALVPDEDIPDAYIGAFLQAKSEIETGATEEDLESQRINALYYMNHYLGTKASRANPWWRAKGTAPYSREIDQLVTKYWDRGPFAKIGAWTKRLEPRDIIEIGCGVGGLAKVVAKGARSYLGVDMAFASIALARHVYLGAPYALPIRIPEDLLNGPLTGKPAAPKIREKGVQLDFVVAELERLPVAMGEFDLAIALNAIDMIEEPRRQPRQQHELLKAGGVAIQSSPYIWHKEVAARLRKSTPKSITTSSAAVEFLYEEEGFEVFQRIEHVPWLFLKHFRQLEMYSVHLFAARKPASTPAES